MANQGDLIEQLLRSTGLSCDDLLLKLQRYKSIKQSENAEEDSSSNSSNLYIEHNVVKYGSVILDTKSSTLDCDSKTILETDTSSSEAQHRERESDSELNNLDNDGPSTLEPDRSDVEKTRSSPETETKSEDDIRDILRMQLSSLRNMKKSTGYLSDLKKPVDFSHLKKKRKSCHLTPLNSDAEKSNIEVGESDNKDVTSNTNSGSKQAEGFNAETGEKKDTGGNGDALVSLCDETGFLILDVSGGVDRLKPQHKNGSLAESPNSKPKKSNYDSGTINNEVPRVSHQMKRKATHSTKEEFAEKSGKSPFVSDSLEDFLNESAKLQISYPIPKLGAEEGITVNTKKGPYEERPQNRHVKYVGNKGGRLKKEPKLMKAKTLADMRRQFEENKTKQTEPKIFTWSKSKKKGFVFNFTPKRNGFLIYDNREIWVNASIEDSSMCLGIIKSNAAESKPKEVSARKPSLLSALIDNPRRKVKYRAGPLSRKAALQDSQSKNAWTTEVKKMPQVFLEVAPQLGKPINPRFVHLLPVFDSEVITAERASFALSVLKPKNAIVKERPAFKFRLSYKNNQSNFLVRKPYCRQETICDTKEDDPQTEIRSVLNDIITYVEIKELGTSYIKEDDTVLEGVDNNATQPLSKYKSRKGKRKKLEMELFRLNCKVINVATEEQENVQCDKPFCKLGCVCNSLLCKSVFSNHCQLVDCMFGCTCSSASTSSLDKSLSVHTVNHLENKAKRNLAKEEREFTQTLIHTDNDVILLGKGTGRRMPKAPTRYRDYVGDMDEFFDNQKPPSNQEEIQLKKCKVLLQRYTFDNIIPLCLFHQTYNCFCKMEAVEPPHSEDTEAVDKARKALPKKAAQKELLLESCARTRPVFHQYIKRNKDWQYNSKLRSKYLGAKHEAAQEHFFEAFIDPVGEDSKITVSKSSKRKQSFNVREEPLDEYPQYSLQRRKKKVKTSGAKPAQYSGVFGGELKLSLRDNEDILQKIGYEYRSLEYLRILPWHHLIENFRSRKMNIWTKNNDSSNLLLCNTASHLPPKNFEDIRKIVHSKSDIINWIISDELPIDIPRDQMHVILLQRKNNFAISGYCLKNINGSHSVEPIAGAREPIEYPHPSSSDMVFCEAIKTHDSSESESIIEPVKKIRLVKLSVEDKPSSVGSDKSILKSNCRQKSVLQTASMSQTTGAKDVQLKGARQGDFECSPSKSYRFSHKDMHNKTKFLVCTSKVFMKRKLFTRLGDKEDITAALPLMKLTRNLRWRMIYLNSDFAFLSFVSVDYSIKYNELLNVVKMANNLEYTITLRNKEFCEQFRHPIFGIFCVPEYKDRLFVGPYLLGEKHNIETHRYLRGTLIETQIFNAMVGKQVLDKNPIWIYESPQKLPFLSRGLVIDITQDEEDAETSASADSPKESIPDTFLGPPFVEEVNQYEIRSRPVNRYIVTNIPHLGYFVAHQYSSKVIEVFWPDFVKGYRFPNVTFAKNVMIQYLSQVFCTYPQDFKISVIILTHMDFNTNNPVCKTYFTKPGSYICGEFGIYHKNSFPENLLTKYNIPSVEPILKLHQEKKENEDMNVRLFGLFLMTNEELRQNPKPVDIIRWAITEIYILNNLKKKYEGDLEDLKSAIRANSFILEQRGETHVKNTTAETIEIEDSDEEEESGGERVPESLLRPNRSLLKTNTGPKPGESLLKINKIYASDQPFVDPLQGTFQSAVDPLQGCSSFLTTRTE